MKSSSILLLVCLAMGTSAAAQVEITAEPHHRLALENRYVRVFQVEVPPHQATQLHWHHHDYIFVTLGAAEVENDVLGRSPTKLKLADGETRFTLGGFAHVAKNPTDSPFRNVTIELLSAAQAAKNSTASDQERSLKVLDGGTRQTLFVKDGVRVVDIELNQRATTPKTSNSGRRLLVALNQLTLQTTRSNGKRTVMSMKTSDVRWLPLAGAWCNLGQKKARFIALEFP